MRRPAVTACPATLRSAVGATGFWTRHPGACMPQPAPTPSPDLHRGVPTRVPGYFILAVCMGGVGGEPEADAWMNSLARVKHPRNLHKIRWRAGLGRIYSYSERAPLGTNKCDVTRMSALSLGVSRVGGRTSTLTTMEVLTYRTRVPGRRAVQVFGSWVDASSPCTQGDEVPSAADGDCS